ncbi:TetR/AcrR family transcriptional regulator [Corallococcus macrosporus]|uniref:TetR/AcrR family transcriptional regulator n=1 Tax=Corallococcus macrosporus TaxID=35 RepID=A0ABS3DBF5_9BACT|nr:TetR/AcrR family transcriptional regulator [Corallococcus macrosporus]MBN8228346.1 TetR/AcrR family transcriptional regulator [Corallococcus macrosporus]
MGERRESKKRETRQRISDAATELFFARGFDAVTLDEIAAAAGVSKMTVFNYFPRKEDLMLDRQDDLKLVFFREAIRARAPGKSPVAELRALMGRLREQKHPFVRFDRHAAEFWRFIAASPSLEARLRELNDEAAEGLATELDGPTPDGLARLAAGMIVLTVRTARQEAIRVFEHGGSAKKAGAVFFTLIDQGFAAVQAIEPSLAGGTFAPDGRDAG